MPLARMLALRYHRDREPLEDLIQVAALGLVKAIDRFDPDRGLAFSTFAVPTITGELKRHFRDATWSIHVPRGMKERVLQVDGVSERLADELGRAPTIGEIAVAADMEDEDVVEAVHVRSVRSQRSLDAPAGAGSDGTRLLADVVGDGDDAFDRAEDRALLARLLRSVSARDRDVLHMRFALDMTQAEIGERLGVSQMQVSRLTRAALERMRDIAERTTPVAEGARAGQFTPG